jgi:hypothetical protein
MSSRLQNLLERNHLPLHTRDPLFQGQWSAISSSRKPRAHGVQIKPRVRRTRATREHRHALPHPKLYPPRGPAELGRQLPLGEPTMPSRTMGERDDLTAQRASPHRSRSPTQRCSLMPQPPTRGRKHRGGPQRTDRRALAIGESTPSTSRTPSRKNRAPGPSCPHEGDRRRSSPPAARNDGRCPATRPVRRRDRDGRVRRSSRVRRAGSSHDEESSGIISGRFRGAASTCSTCRLDKESTDTGLVEGWRTLELQMPPGPF